MQQRFGKGSKAGAFRLATVAGVLALVASGCAIARVSVSSTGTEGTQASSKVLGVTDDGRYSLFVSDAPNLVAGDSNRQPDVFRHDATTGATIRIDLSKTGAQLTSGAVDGALSSDGRYAAFVTLDSLDISDTNGTTDVYIRDLVGNATMWISRAPGNQALSGGVQQPPGGNGLVISADGRYVAYLWQNAGFPPLTTLYLRDRVGHTTLAMTDGSYKAGMLSSRDLRHYVYQTSCYQGGCSPRPVLLDTDAVDGWPTLPFADCAFASVDAMSASGRYLVWNSQGGLPAPCLAGGHYLVDRAAGTATQIGRMNQTSVTGISADGNALLYLADGSRLPGGTAGRMDLYLRNRATGTDTRLDVATDGGPANGDITRAVLSDEGHRTLFASSASNLVQDDHNGVSDTFLRAAVPPAP
jgi:hypothetical protein